MISEIVYILAKDRVYNLSYHDMITLFPPILRYNCLLLSSHYLFIYLKIFILNNNKAIDRNG